MTNPFDRLASSTRGVVERVNGKAVTIFPMSSVDTTAPPVADAATAWSTVACFYSDTLAKEQAISQPLTNTGRLNHRSLQLQASIRLVPDKDLRTTFLLRRDEDGEFFTIERIDPDGVGGVMAILTAARKPVIANA